MATDGLPELMVAPTGSGKTGIALAWLYRRRFHPDPQVRAATPNRLVLCLPLRTLVEQIHSVVGGWLKALWLGEGVGVRQLLRGADELIA